MKKIVVFFLGLAVCFGMFGCARKDTEEYKKEVWTANEAGYYNGAAIYQMYCVDYADVELEYRDDTGISTDWKKFGNDNHEIPIYVKGKISSVSLENNPTLQSELRDLLDSMYDDFGLDPDAMGKNIVIKLNDVFGLEWKIQVGYEKLNSIKVMEALIGQEVVVLCTDNAYGISEKEVRADAVMWNGNIFAITAYNDTFLNDVEDSKKG